MWGRPPPTPASCRLVGSLRGTCPPQPSVAGSSERSGRRHRLCTAGIASSCLLRFFEPGLGIHLRATLALPTRRTRDDRNRQAAPRWSMRLDLAMLPRRTVRDRLAQNRRVSADFFTEVPGRIRYGGPDSADALSYAVYQPDRMVGGKRMEDHLRIAVRLGDSLYLPRP